jgi:translation initiation factor 4E
MSTLTGPALAASKAALSAALNETPDPTPNDEDLGEVQEVDMQTQAETIRTVFSDPTNFNVKVRALLYLLSSDNVAI